MDDKISSLSSLDSWWGYFLVISTLIVLLGVAAEALQFMRWVSQRPRLKHSLERGAFLVLVVGIAGELLGESKTISVGDQLYGLLNDKAGAANERAARAEKESSAAALKAEQLKAENLVVEATIAARRINPAQCKDIAASVKSFSGLTVRVDSYSMDADGGLLGWQIVGCLVSAHSVYVDMELSSILSAGAFGFGVFVSGKNESLVSAIKAALERANINVVDGTGLFPPNQLTYRPGAPSNPDATVVVGIKPPIDMK